MKTVSHLIRNSVSHLLSSRRLQKRDYGALTDCFFDLRAAIHSAPKTSDEYNKLVVSPIRNSEKTVYQRALWLSTTWPKVTSALQTFARTAVAIQVRLPDMPTQSLPPPGSIPLDVEAFENAYFSAGNAIGKALGIPSLENELRGIMSVPAINDPESALSR